LQCEITLSKMVGGIYLYHIQVKDKVLTYSLRKYCNSKMYISRYKDNELHKAQP